MYLNRYIAFVVSLCFFLCGCYAPVSESSEQITEFTETVIYDDSAFRITAKDIQHNSGNIEIKVLVENNSQYNATVYCDTFIVNDIVLSALMWIDTAAGAKSNGTIYLDKSDLYTAGIEQINTLSSYGAYISFDGSNTQDITFFIVENADYVQSINEEGKVLYSENGITIISKFEPDKHSNKIPLLIKNESGQDLHIGTNYVTVNGYTISQWKYYTPICSGTYRFFSIELTSWGLEENNIEKIESASFSIDFMSPDSTQVIFQTGNLTA